MIKYAIFDMDGTLMDSMGVWDTAGYDFLIQNGIKVDKSVDNIFKQMSIQQVGCRMIKDFGLKMSEKEIIDEINDDVEKKYKSVVPKPGVISLLDEFRHNDVKMSVATATDKYLVEDVLSRNGLTKFFDNILTCTENGSGKDKPFIYRNLMNKMSGTKSLTYIFEDAPYAVKTAHNDGFKVVGVYDESFCKEQETVRSNCDKYINSFTELRYKDL